MDNIKNLKQAIAKFQSKELNENEFFEIVMAIAMARNRNAAERKIEGLMEPFWVHFLRENFGLSSVTNIRDLKSFIRAVKKANRKKGELNQFWFNEDELQEIAEDYIDTGIRRLRRKYRRSSVDIEVLIEKIGNREKPLEFKENKLWSQGFKFSVFDETFYSLW